MRFPSPSNFIALLLLSSITANAQNIPHFNMREYMTAQEFRDAGLEKISPQEYEVLEQWFNRYTLNVYRAAKGSRRAGTPDNDYLVENSVDNETFIINGNAYKAKTQCMKLHKGDRVIFSEGNASGACISAKLFNLKDGEFCDVWCK